MNTFFKRSIFSKDYHGEKSTLYANMNIIVLYKLTWPPAWLVSCLNLGVPLDGVITDSGKCLIPNNQTEFVLHATIGNDSKNSLDQGKLL